MKKLLTIATLLALQAFAQEASPDVIKAFPNAACVTDSGRVYRCVDGPPDQQAWFVTYYEAGRLEIGTGGELWWNSGAGVKVEQFASKDAAESRAKSLKESGAERVVLWQAKRPSGSDPTLSDTTYTWPYGGSSFTVDTTLTNDTLTYFEGAQ